jgi:single-stranded DNA-binding protein
VFVNDYHIVEEGNENDVSINGYICKEPVYRKTPLGREIAEAMIAVNRKYGKADYIPCLFWGRNARFLEKLAIGDFLAVKGRLQSRIYVKNVGDGKLEQRTVYELSASQIATLDANGGLKDIENYFLTGGANGKQ